MKITFQESTITKLLCMALFVISVMVFGNYFFQGQNVLYGDAVSRLNISRKLFDNLTPGFGQLGNVWLPFPILMMAPFNLDSYFWHSGLSGAIISMLAYIIG